MTSILSSMALSSETLGPEAEATLLRSVRETHCESALFLLDRATILTLARLTLALRTAETNLNDDPEDEDSRLTDARGEMCWSCSGPRKRCG